MGLILKIAEALEIENPRHLVDDGVELDADAVIVLRIDQGNYSSLEDAYLAICVGHGVIG